MEWTISKSVPEGVTMLDIWDEEEKLVKLVESYDSNGGVIDPLFSSMDQSTKSSRTLSKSNRILTRNEVVLNPSAVLAQRSNYASFDVGYASSSEVSSVSADTSTPPIEKKTFER